MTTHLAERIDAYERVHGRARTAGIEGAIDEAVRQATRDEFEMKVDVTVFADGTVNVAHVSGGPNEGIRSDLMSAIQRLAKKRLVKFPIGVRGIRARFNVSSYFQLPEGNKMRDLGTKGPRLVSEDNQKRVEFFRYNGKVGSLGLSAGIRHPKASAKGKCSVDDPCDETSNKYNKLLDQSFSVDIGLSGGIMLSNIGARPMREVNSVIESEERILEEEAPTTLPSPVTRPNHTAPSGSASP